ncbi:aldose 1-epimerase [Superficieibacter sp. BNK-5]|uniref:aldose 1-epimerase n=1 Tax=Superficieibacter sp. BNK-5 TaxID=3376142 RepID=UPI0039BF571F
MTRLIERTLGTLTFTVAPELGGALASLRWKGHDILRPRDPHGEQRANQCASYPLIPWFNRIADGRFFFAGKARQVAKNFGDHPHAIHGQGWLSPWSVAEESDCRIVLTLDMPASPGWPWPWRGVQTFDATQERLSVTLCYHNLAGEAVPAGLGFHPFFAQADACELFFSAPRVWINNDESLPVDELATPPEWNYSSFRAPVAGSVDNCFCGWSGEATVRWPQKNIRATLTCHDTECAVLFIPGAERNVVAIEPVSHINNAINLFPCGQDKRAMDIVAAGDSICLGMTIRMSDDE